MERLRVSKGNATPQEPEETELPTALGTNPYFPSDKFSQLEGTNLANGLVITDKAENEEIGNEYVWIEVPSTAVDATATGGPDYSGVSGATDYTNIKTALKAYVEDFERGSSTEINKGYTWNDEWYDGCGIANSTDYNNLYHTMLKSVYENGGFWIGRYEAGQTGNTGRTDKNDSIDGMVPLSKQNLIPIFYITCSQAQTIASNVQNKGTYNSSLMFGIQWDLVMKYLENKGVSYADLATDSINWGNYKNSTNVSLSRGKYARTCTVSFGMYGPTTTTKINEWYDYTEDYEDYIKNSILNNTNSGPPSSFVITTGASNQFCKKNIYDLAGNLEEWTLQQAFSGYDHEGGAYYEISGPSTCRGGVCQTSRN